MTVGERIRERRLALGLNKAQLAQHVGCSDVAISYWERGTVRSVSSGHLLSLATALECTVSELVGDPRLNALKAQVAAETLEVVSTLQGLGLSDDQRNSLLEMARLERCLAKEGGA
ncbi:hypothetical protein L861_09090 [Litchfieldella anticariensis FP35 = DSM 16096]|uniref:HTH cro/C1-type domain-containing protein n=1 Tax=Litchfieldella anticariensis (strain DSM 16096 / CECT 5854 / CIP 108499 / LMG 22089 / FP35) TaxID=1121939 RepID=S2KKM7_LITA3|nr:helix-turn-helix domain-containing protein [Halomonas anticariensis]EPC02495.1 hypothetical protein L861_09090 [Halomonas anticariensis FP35 = DSM 16096]